MCPEKTAKKITVILLVQTDMPVFVILQYTTKQRYELVFFSFYS